ncbi:hypothetical protein OC834_005158 [Tilletia horrida]|nr:hypothetical protein OC834_005158 [Tilletia horrida]
MPEASSASTASAHAPNIIALPGELLLHVVRHAMTPDKMEQETLQAYLKRGLTLKLVSKKFAEATAQHLQHHLHAYGTPLAITSEKQPWHPQSKNIEAYGKYWGTIYGRKYWDRFPNLAMTKHALSLTKIPSLRTLSLDIRHKHGHYELRTNGVRASNGTDITYILTRLIESARNLNELNLRISPDRETLRAVEQLLRATPTLLYVNIEIDSAKSLPRPKVVFQLHHIVDESTTYRSFEHFVLRCPDVKHFGICARELRSHTKDWRWLWQLLSCTPELRVCQFATVMPSWNGASSRISNPKPRTLRHLTDLTLEIAGVDTNLFRHLGPSALRLTRLGVPFCKFWRNLRPPWHNYDPCHDTSFSAALHGPTWAPINLAIDDHDVTVFDLPLPKMEEGEKRRFDIPVGEYKWEGESVLEGPPHKKRRLCLFSTELLTF